MKIEVFRKLLSQIRDMTNYLCINEIYLHWFGEPFFHPEFLKLVELIVNDNMKYRLCKALTFHTNANLLDSEKIALFLKIIRGIDFPFSVTFSLDAVTPSTYKEIRRGGDFDLAVKNTKELLRKGKSNPWLKFILQFIVMEENHHEAEPFVRYWSEFLDREDMHYKISFNFVPADCQETHLIYLRQLDGGYKKPTQLKYNRIHQNTVKKFKDKIRTPVVSLALNSKKEKIPQGIKYHGTKLDEQSFLCSNLWDSLAVTWDGSVTIICDQWLTLQLGNIRWMHLLYTYFSKRNLNALRRAHLLGILTTKHRDCKNCGIVLCEHNGNTHFREIEAFVEAERKYLTDLKKNPGLGRFV